MDYKKLIILFLVIVIALAFYLNSTKETASQSLEAPNGIIKSEQIDTLSSIDNLHEVNLDIKGMSCVSCAYGVESQIKELDGVVSAKINYKTSTGIVIYDADKVNAETIAKASTAYQATVDTDRRL